MADIKRCPICGGRTVIFREKGGFRWVHTCKSPDESYPTFRGKPKNKFGDAVRDWNERVKSMLKIKDAFADYFKTGRSVRFVKGDKSNEYTCFIR